MPSWLVSTALCVLGCAQPAGVVVTLPTSESALVSVPTDPAFEPALATALREGRTVTVSLQAVRATVRVDGAPVEMLTYNGSYPGPTIVVREGDRLVVQVENKLTEDTNIHWHGLNVPADQDDATLVIPPGGRHAFAFDLRTGSAGTHWYHPHLHGQVASQVARGLFGAIRVLSADDPLAGAGDTLAVLSDARIEAGAAVAGQAAERSNGFEGEVVLVNGRVRPTLTLKPGEVRRIRLVNAAASRYFRLASTAGGLEVVGSDGGLLEHPVAATELLLAPGERAEVLVNAPALEGKVLGLDDLGYDRGTAAHIEAGMHHHEVLDPAASVLFGVVAEGSPAPPWSRPATMRTILAPTASARVREITLSEDHLTQDFRINGRTFDHDRVDLQARLGETETWAVSNTGHMDHPFHLHAFAFQVLDRNGQREGYAAWKDTVNVRAGETVRLAIPFDGYAGKRVFHCHILDHEDLGMMGLLEVN